jgi:hypothetical protein
MTAFWPSMLTQEQAVEIRVMARRGGGVRAIAKQLGCSRNTVRRYLREADARRYNRECRDRASSTRTRTTFASAWSRPGRGGSRPRCCCARPCTRLRPLHGYWVTDRFRPVSRRIENRSPWRGRLACPSQSRTVLRKPDSVAFAKRRPISGSVPLRYQIIMLPSWTACR